MVRSSGSVSRRRVRSALFGPPAATASSRPGSRSRSGMCSTPAGSASAWTTRGATSPPHSRCSDPGPGSTKTSTTTDSYCRPARARPSCSGEVRQRVVECNPGGGGAAAVRPVAVGAARLERALPPGRPAAPGLRPQRLRSRRQCPHDWDEEGGRRRVGSASVAGSPRLVGWGSDARSVRAIRGRAPEPCGYRESFSGAVRDPVFASGTGRAEEAT